VEERALSPTLSSRPLPTDLWFRIRVAIKDFFKRLCHCRLDDPPARPIEHDVDLDDRGHGYQHPGYLRRQVQFFSYKIFSQFHAYINFLLLTPALRWGYNKEYYPVSEAGSHGCLTRDVSGWGKATHLFQTNLPALEIRHSYCLYYYSDVCFRSIRIDWILVYYTLSKENL